MKESRQKRIPLALITISYPDNGEVNFIVKNKRYVNIMKYINRMMLWRDYSVDVSQIGEYEYVILKKDVINLNRKFD